MNRYLPILAILPVAGLPLTVKPTWTVGAIGLVAGLVCLVGLLRRSPGATLAGGVLAVIDLALALWWSAASLGVFGAVTFGLALLLLLEGTHFANRFAGAEVDPTVWGSQVAWWIARAAACFGVAVVLVVIASALASFVPLFGRPVIAAAGALAAVVAATLAAQPEEERADPVAPRENTRSTGPDR
jgi:hypothetical protein